MRLSGQFSYKESDIKKRKTSKNQLTKQKQANIKQQKQQFFAHKNFIRGENCLFCAFLCFKIFLKKKKIDRKLS